MIWLGYILVAVVGLTIGLVVGAWLRWWGVE